MLFCRAVSMPRELKSSLRNSQLRCGRHLSSNTRCLRRVAAVPSPTLSHPRHPSRLRLLPRPWAWHRCFRMRWPHNVLLPSFLASKAAKHSLTGSDLERHGRPSSTATCKQSICRSDRRKAADRPQEGPTLIKASSEPQRFSLARYSCIQAPGSNHGIVCLFVCLFYFRLLRPHQRQPECN